MELKSFPQSLIFARLNMEMARCLGTGVYAIGKNRSARLDFSQVMSALVIGYSEGRPFTASKIAGYIGMPRGNVLRKLRTLEHEGIVKREGTAFFLVDERLNAEEWIRNGNAMERAIRRAAARLDRLRNENLMSEYVRNEQLPSRHLP
jgi:hypothetical protein